MLLLLEVHLADVAVQPVGFREVLSPQKIFVGKVGAKPTDDPFFPPILSYINFLIYQNLSQIMVEPLHSVQGGLSDRIVGLG